MVRPVSEPRRLTLTLRGAAPTGAPVLIIVALSLLGLIYLDLITSRPNPDTPGGNVMYSLVMGYVMYLLIDTTVSSIE